MTAIMTYKQFYQYKILYIEFSGVYIFWVFDLTKCSRLPTLGSFAQILLRPHFQN